MLIFCSTETDTVTATDIVTETDFVTATDTVVDDLLYDLWHR